MALINLRQQTWFVLLMAFVLSWSSVSIANAKSMHMPKSQVVTPTSMQHDRPYSAKAPVPCHKMPTSSEPARSTDTLATCHAMDFSKTSHQQGCVDCHAVHCQAMNFMLETQIPSLKTQCNQPLVQQFNGQYAAQDLAGYWQEILRPPKA